MITPSFGLTATERVLPRLALDFTTASLDSRITFTRAGATATRVNSSGYIEVVAADTPRFDFDPVSLVCKGLLIEESRINAFTDSNTPSNWVLANASIGVTPITSPDGTANAYKLTETAVLGTHTGRSINSIAYVSGTTYSFSLFAKSTERFVQLQLASTAFGGSTASNAAVFNLTDGTIAATGAGVTASIANAGNGYYRCTITRVATTTVSSATTALFALRDAGTIDVSTGYLGDGTSGAYIYGVQLEAGPFPTSYIPTTTTSLTRNADVATMTGTNFSDWFNASEGTFKIAASLIKAAAATNRGLFRAFNSGDSAQRTAVFISTTAVPTMLAVNATTQASITSGTVIDNTVFSVCAGYKLDNFGISKDAATVSIDVSGTVPTGVNSLNLGFDAASTTYLNGWLNKMFFYPQKLITAEIQAFSKG